MEAVLDRSLTTQAFQQSASLPNTGTIDAEETLNHNTSSKDQAADGDKQLSQETSHHRNLREIAQTLTKACPLLLDQRKIAYDRVTVLSISWEDPEYEGMAQNVKAIEDVFRDEYKYDVIPFVILKKFEDPYAELMFQLSRIRRELSRKDKHNLLILYYCGHADRVDDDGRLVWKPKVKSRASLDWSEMQRNLRSADMDLFFILDCCYASRMVIGNKGQEWHWKRRCELLGATDILNRARAEEQMSFSQLLATVLRQHATVGGIRAAEIRMYLSDQENFKTSNKVNGKTQYITKVPDYWRCHDLKAYPYGIFLEPRPNFPPPPRQVDKSIVPAFERLEANTDTTMIIAAQFPEGVGTISDEIFHGWLRVTPDVISALSFHVLTDSELEQLDGVLKTSLTNPKLDAKC